MQFPFENLKYIILLYILLFKLVLHDKQDIFFEFPFNSQVAQFS